MVEGIKLAYLAGALDGDGSFSLMKATSHTSKSPLYFPLIQMANAHKKLIDLFVESFGGSERIRGAYTGRDGASRRISYQWKLEKSVKCKPFLDSIIPFLVIKKQRAQLLRDYILNNPFMRGAGKINDETLFNRERSYLKMLSFNQNPNTSGELLNKSKRKNSEDRLFWSYVAGLMDTDGSFSLKRENRKSGGSKSPVYTPSILLTMVDCRAIYFIKNNFDGGSILVVRAKTTTNGMCYRFNITSRADAINFLEKVIPFLVLKKNVAEHLLYFCKNVELANGRNGVNDDQKLFREKCYVSIRQLNNGVVKSFLMDLKPLPDYAEGNKAQAGVKPCSVNVASGKTSKDDAVL